MALAKGRLLTKMAQKLVLKDTLPILIGLKKSFEAVHSPLQAADKYMDQFKHIEDIQRRIFAAMLANLDDSVGGIMKKLAKENLEKDTLVFFLSDNGAPTRPPSIGDNGRLKGCLLYTSDAADE